MKRFQVIDESYALGKFQRRNIIYRALPDEIQRDVDKEHAKGAIPAYDDFIDFVKHFSNSSRFHTAQAPKPPTANLLQDETQRELEHSVDEWTAYIEAENPPEAEMGNLPAEGLQALYAIAKGKGRTAKGQPKGYGATKGNGKGKGGKGTKDRGKGPILGKCHNCDETSHMARDLHTPKLQSPRS